VKGGGKGKKSKSSDKGIGRGEEAIGK